MAMTIKQAAQTAGIPAPLIRLLLTLRLVPGTKVRGTWMLDTAAVQRIVAAFTILRRPEEAAPPAPLPEMYSVLHRCPNCGQPYGKVSEQQGGWGEFYQCKACSFSIHEHNLISPELIQRTVEEYRRYLNS